MVCNSFQHLARPRLTFGDSNVSVNVKQWASDFQLIDIYNLISGFIRISRLTNLINNPDLHLLNSNLKITDKLDNLSSPAHQRRRKGCTPKRHYLKKVEKWCIRTFADKTHSISLVIQHWFNNRKLQASKELFIAAGIVQSQRKQFKIKKSWTQLRIQIPNVFDNFCCSSW